MCQVILIRNIKNHVVVYDLDNTRRLNVEETKAKIASLEYIQNELNGVVNLAR